jgi:RNA polymerase sigma-70 factor (ECF subfamily)
MNRQSCADICFSQPESDAEASLIVGLKVGDARAFEKMVRQYAGPLLAVAKRFFTCEQDAHDALQDAFICVHRKADTFEENSRLSTWLHRVTVNACLMKLRSQRRRQ